MTGIKSLNLPEGGAEGVKIKRAIQRVMSDLSKDRLCALSRALHIVCDASLRKTQQKMLHLKGLGARSFSTKLKPDRVCPLV